MRNYNQFNSIRIMRKSSGKKSKAQFEMIGEELIGQSEEIQAKKKRKAKGKRKSKNQDGDQDEVNQDEKNNKTTAQVWTIYRKFFAYTLKRWKWGLCCIIVTIISAFFQSILPYKLGQLLDLITNQTSNPECTLLEQKCSVFKTVLTQQMLIIGGLTVLIGIGTFVRYLVLQLFQEQLGMDLKCQIFNIFIQNDINFFQIHESNALVSRLSNDVNQAKSAISNNLTMLLRNVILCIGSFIVLMGMSWRCTLIMLSIIPPYSYITLVYKRKAKQLIKKRQDVQAQITVHVGEKFAGIHLIKSSNTEELQMNKYKELNTRVYQLNKERTLYQGIHTTCSSFLPSLGSLFVLIYAGTRLLVGEPELSAGELTSFILYCSSLASSAASISNSYTNIINGTSAIQRVFEMMNYKKLIEEDKGDKIDLDGAIHFENVSFSYPSGQKEKTEDQQQPIDARDSIMTQKTENTDFSEEQKQSPLRSIRIKNNNSHKILKLFNNINFNIKRGEYVGFVGQSGSGKSTILKLIQHFYRIQDGTILFGGKRAFKESQNQGIQKGELQLSSGDHDLSLREISQEKTLHRSDSLNIKYLRKQIGVVSQEATLFNGTIEENITYGLENYTEQQLLEAAEKSGCLQFLNNHNTFHQGFQTIVGERGNKLSGGQKQRVSIARALLKKPKILLFDEATSALDSHSESVIKQTIEGLSKSQELTIVVIAHRLSTVVHCDRLFVMKEGNIVQVGSHKELMSKRGYYYQLIQKQLHEKNGQTLQKQLQFS